MSMDAIKQKGRRVENALADYLRGWWPHAERRRLRGDADAGDITGTPGVVWECKASDQMRSEGMRQLASEVAADGAEYGVLVERRKRHDVSEWYATMTLEQACQLLAEAGYADPRQEAP